MDLPTKNTNGSPVRSQLHEQTVFLIHGSIHFSSTVIYASGRTRAFFQIETDCLWTLLTPLLALLAVSVVVVIVVLTVVAEVVVVLLAAL